MKHRPPVEGLPTPRPRCAFCNRPLGYWTNDERANGLTGPIVRRTFTRWNAYLGLFDRLRCALDFAAAAHRAGYRITPSPRNPVTAERETV